MTSDIVRDDADDWWAWHKQMEDEMREIEESYYNERGLLKNRKEMQVMQVYPQDNMDAIQGTFLQGHVTARYDELVRAFSYPLEGDGSKTRAEWVLVFSIPRDGDEPNEDVVATIYDWKKYDQPVSLVTQWNVGGMTSESLYAVQDYLNYVRDMEAKQDAEVRQSA